MVSQSLYKLLHENISGEQIATLFNRRKMKITEIHKQIRLIFPLNL